MKSEFLPTDNRDAAAGGDRGRCDETSEGRWKKKFAAEKRSERRRGRPIANGFCGFLARSRMWPVYTYMRSLLSRSFPAAHPNGRVSKRERVKRAMTYRCASNCCAAKTAVLFTHRTRSVYIYIELIVVSACASFSVPLFAKYAKG